MAKETRRNEGALEAILGNEGIKEISGKPFGINPNMNYERREFVKRAGSLFDVEGYYGKLKENINDADALNDLAGLAVKFMAGGEDAQNENRSQLLENHNLALSQAEELLDTGYTSMAKFIEKNREYVLDRLSEKELIELFLRVPLYKTGQREHDRIKDLRDKIMQIQQAQEKREDISRIVGEEIESLVESIPEEQKKYLFKNIHLVMPGYKNIVARALAKKLDSEFKDPKGNLNKGKLISYLTRNYKVVEDFIENELEEEKDKQDYWDKNLKTQYVEVARTLYKTEKAKQKKADNPEKEKLKQRAKELGLTNP